MADTLPLLLISCFLLLILHSATVSRRTCTHISLAIESLCRYCVQHFRCHHNGWISINASIKSHLSRSRRAENGTSLTYHDDHDQKPTIFPQSALLGKIAEEIRFLPASTVLNLAHHPQIFVRASGLMTTNFLFERIEIIAVSSNDK
jgi:hypothetical protein